MKPTVQDTFEQLNAISRIRALTNAESRSLQRCIRAIDGDHKEPTRTRITAAEADSIIHLLKTRPLPEVRALTNRSYMTLIRMAARGL